MTKLYYAGPPSDHFDGVRFHNRYAPTTDRTLIDIWRWKRQRSAAAWPAPVAHGRTDRPPPGSITPRVVLIGHASLLIQAAGCTIVVDPVWSARASPLAFAGPRRHQPPGIAFHDLPRIDVVLLTHSHYDHMDAATLRRLWRRDRPRIIAPLGNNAVLARAAPGLVVQTADWWDRLALAPGLALTLCPANHWSSRTLRDRRQALWCGYWLHSADCPIYIAGDTAFGGGALFSAIRARLGAPRLAVLPIGAYAPRWFMAGQHMDPDEAVQAMLACGASEAWGVHWGTFQLTDEAQDAPAIALVDALAARAPGAAFHAARPADVWLGGSGDHAGL